jgi:cytochrome P450
MTATAAPATDYDPFTMDAILDPHLHDGRLREETPVAYLPQYDVYALTRHADIRAALRDPRTFSSTDRPFYVPSNLKPSMMVMEDAPHHTVIKKVALEFLNKQEIAHLQQTFERESMALIERLMAGGAADVDAAQDVAAAFILKVFPDAIGAPVEGRENLIAFGDAVFNSTSPRNELYHRKMERAVPALAWVEENMKRSALSPGGWGARVFEIVDEGRLTEDEGEQLVKTIFAAGYDTTASTIGSLLRAFADNPDQWDLARERPELVDSAIEEGLRYYAASRYGGRLVTQDVEIAGHLLPAGAKVMMMWLGAGRDPRQWTDPDRFDIAREGVGGHISFGFGVHACLGQHIARIEAKAMLEALIPRVSRIERTGDVEMLDNMQAFGHHHIPVRLHP